MSKMVSKAHAETFEELEKRLEKGWGAVEFDYGLLKRLIKDEEWYNIPQCIKFAVRMLINCVEVQNNKNIQVERTFAEKIEFLQQAITIEQTVIKQQASENMNKFEVVNKRQGEGFKQLQEKINENYNKFREALVEQGAKIKQREKEIVELKDASFAGLTDLKKAF